MRQREVVEQADSRDFVPARIADCIRVTASVSRKLVTPAGAGPVADPG